MSELFNLIKKIKVESASTDSYVYYDKNTGEISKISSVSTPSTEYEIAIIPNVEVMPILTGTKRVNEYIIYNNVRSKKIELRLINEINYSSTSDTTCFRLPTTNNISLIDKKSKDIIICQDLINKVWTIELGQDLKTHLSTAQNLIETLYFSVTQKFNPNVLYRSLEVNLLDLINESNIQIPFKYQVEGESANISIYTAKNYSNYIHEIIK